jgi:hypothetical protein
MRSPNRWDYNYKGREKLKEVKLELCYLIKRHQARENLTAKALAFYMGTSQSNVSLVSRLNVDKLTINQLFRYLVLLEPEFKMLIAV